MGELEIFAIRIKELRESFNMTQRDFSKYIGVKQQTLSGYERGLMKPPLDVVTEMAKKCNVSIDWLCGLSSDKNNKKVIKTYSDILQIMAELCDLDLVTGTFKIELDAIPDFENNSVSFKSGIFSTDEKLYNLLSDLNKMREILASGTLNQNIYDTWFNGFLEKHNQALITWDDVIIKTPSENDKKEEY